MMVCDFSKWAIEVKGFQLEARLWEQKHNFVRACVFPSDWYILIFVIIINLTSTFFQD